MSTTPMQDPSQIQAQLQGVAQQAQSNMLPTPQVGPDQGSPVRRFLTNIFYGAGQAALQHVGLPTDYEKQQQAIQNNQRQQQLANQAQETSSLIGLHQQQLANEAQAFRERAYQDQQVAIPDEYKSFYPGQTTVRRGDLHQILTTASGLQQRQPMAVPDAVADVFGIEHGTMMDPRYIGPLSKAAAVSNKAWQVTDANGIKVRINKVTGEQQPVLDPSGKPLKSNAVITPQLRAYYSAKYGAFPTMDDAGNPTTISRLDALQGGTPSMTEKQVTGLQADRTGISQFMDNNNFFRQHMSVLDDPIQRGLIARATKEGEGSPGAAQSIIESYAQQGMTPEAAEFASRLLNQREVSAIPRKYAGQGGQGTDALRGIVNGNLPSSAHTKALNLALLDRDDQMARGVLQNLQRPSAYSPKARTPNDTSLSPQSAPTPGGGFNWSQFGGSTR